MQRRARQFGLRHDKQSAAHLCAAPCSVGEVSERLPRDLTATLAYSCGSYTSRREHIVCFNFCARQLKFTRGSLG